MDFICWGQVSYSTIAPGAWNVSGTWVPGVPSAPLLLGDSIIVNHAIVYNVNQTILGVMLVNVSGSLTGTGASDLDIGRNTINQGELINYGSITVRDMEVKPGNGCLLPS